jgi:hypothetical protein
MQKVSTGVTQVQHCEPKGRRVTMMPYRWFLVQVCVLCLLSLNGSNYLLGGRQRQPPSPTPDFLAVVQAGMDPQTVHLSPSPQQLADHFATLAGSTRTWPLNLQLRALSQDATCQQARHHAPQVEVGNRGYSSCQVGW